MQTEMEGTGEGGVAHNEGRVVPQMDIGQWPGGEQQQGLNVRHCHGTGAEYRPNSFAEN